MASAMCQLGFMPAVMETCASTKRGAIPRIVPRGLRNGLLQTSKTLKLGFGNNARRMPTLARGIVCSSVSNLQVEYIAIAWHTSISYVFI